MKLSSFASCIVLVGLSLASCSRLPGAQQMLIPAHLSSTHPRFSTLPGRSLADLRNRLAVDPVARAALTSAQAELAPYLAHTATDPMWLASRLQMYWTSHATEVYNRGDVFDHTSGHDPVPTVRFPGSRDPVTIYRAPELADIPPYEDDTRGVWLRNTSLPNSPAEWAPPAKSGRVIDGINNQILRLAQTAARLYFLTGEERYAAFAFPVLDTYLRGIAARSEPIDLNHGHSQTLYGMTTFEVIQEGWLPVVADTYDLLHGYIAHNHPRAMPLYADALRRWVDITVRNGVPFNNWDLIEARFIAAVALVLDDDSAYPDHHGAQFYLNEILNDSLTRQWSLRKLAARGFSPATGIWFESPGYSVNVVNDFITLINDLDDALNTDLLASLPVVGKAVFAAGQYLLPNGTTVAFGDSHYGPLSPAAALQMVRNAQRHHRSEQEVRFTGMAKLLQSLSPPNAAANGAHRVLGLDALFTSSPVRLDPGIPPLTLADLTSPTFSAPNVSFFIQRSSVTNGTATRSDATTSLALSENGSLGNHQHANGVAIELYGMGTILGPESGIGTNYFQPDYAEYYSQFPAHNTVVVDGISAYPTMKSHHGFAVESAFPPPPEVASATRSPAFHRVTFSEVRFLEPETDADQDRLLSIIRPDPSSDTSLGYYVDIFRSRRRDGHDLRHEYFFHGLAQTLDITAADGHPLTQTPTERLTFANEELNAYDYLYDKRQVATAPDYRASFHLQLPDCPAIDLRVWLAGGPHRELFQVKSPPSRALRDTVPAAIAALPLPTVVVRQTGEAWTHPFITVFEPTDAEHPAAIAAIHQLHPANVPPEFVDLEIQRTDGSSQTILSSVPSKTTPSAAGPDQPAATSAPITVGNLHFEGTYAVLSTSSSPASPTPGAKATPDPPTRTEWMLLGSGRSLERDGLRLEFDTANAAGSVEHTGDFWQILLLQPGRLSVPTAELHGTTTLKITSGSGSPLLRHGTPETLNGHPVLVFTLPALPLSPIHWTP